jgi:branched-chain amino acid aminotransferase
MVAFGSVLAEQMVSVRTKEGRYGEPEVHPVEPLSLSPATHALHYGSACFEGLKAHPGTDGVVRIFRPGDHARRMVGSAEAVCLPAPDPELVEEMLRMAVTANLGEVPEVPGALYLRPTLIGLDPNIGAAAHASVEALLFVIASPVGEYFSGAKALTVAVETALPRTTPQFGSVKAGANYVMALGLTRKAREEHGADQVLFAPGGDVQETGAANAILLDDERLVTKALDGTFLHGITRDSILRLAADLGYGVEERDIPVDELLGWQGEVALCGTAAVLAGVGTLVHGGERITVGDGGVGRHTLRLREALIAIQRGEAEDRWGWTVPVS